MARLTLLLVLALGLLVASAHAGARNPSRKPGPKAVKKAPVSKVVKPGPSGKQTTTTTKTTTTVTTTTTSPTPAPTFNSVVDAAVATPELSTLVTLVGKAGLAGALGPDFNGTVFAPLNSAFAKLPAEKVEYLLSDAGKVDLTNILLYHVSGAAVTKDAFDNEATVNTLISWASLKLDENNDQLLVKAVGSTAVVKAVVKAGHATIYVIDTVLLPLAPVVPAPTFNSVVEAAVATAELSTLVTLVGKAGLAGALGPDFNGTVFAPLNSAFAKLPAEKVEYLLSDAGKVDLTNILLYHVSGAAVTKDAFDNEATVNTLISWASLKLDENNDQLLVKAVGSTAVVKAVVKAGHATIYVIDTVLLPLAPVVPAPTFNSVVEAAVATAELSTLVTLVGKAGLAGALGPDFNGTVFAPLNSAFAKLPAEKVEYLLSDAGKVDLTNILLYHVSGAAVTKDAFDNEATVNTLISWASLKLDENNDQLLVKAVGSTAVVKAVVKAGHATIYVIDTVLLPLAPVVPAPTFNSVVEAAVATAELSTLVTLVGKAGLAGALGPDFNGTVFAPLNSAFAKLPAEKVEYLLSDAGKVDLTNILLYHVSGAAVTKDAFDNEATVNTLISWASLKLDENNDQLLVKAVGSTAVVKAVVKAGHATIYVIDTVLLPLAPVVPAPTFNSVVEAAVATAELSTLVTLVGKAGLAGALGPDFNGTVFAPLNSAFAKLPAEKVEYLLSDAGKVDLTNILLYHVSGAAVTKDAFDNEATVNTLISWASLKLDENNDQLLVKAVGSTAVVKAVVKAGHATIYVIDTVLLPLAPVVPAPTFNSVVEAAVATAELSTLVTLVGKAGLAGALGPDFNGTVFAPLNSAFAKLPAEKVEYLLSDAGKVDLTNILLYHVSGAAVTKDAFDNEATVNTLISWASLKLDENNDQLLVKAVGSTAVVKAVVKAGHATIYVIDTVLLPLAPVVPAPTFNSVVEAAVATAELSTLVTLVGKAGLAGALGPDFNGTVFAPLNSAFAKLPAEKVEYLLSDAGKVDLTNYLLYHVSGAAVTKDAFDNEATVNTLISWASLKLDENNDQLLVKAVGSTAVVKAVVKAGHATIYVIDTVLRPMVVVV